MANNDKVNNDIFADIASQTVRYRTENLVEPCPLNLPEKYLPNNKHDPKAVFKPLEKVDSAEKLKSILSEFKSKYLKFMADLAPKIANIRRRIELPSFDWRIETNEDKLQFLSALTGKGQWQKVAIPHFGEPLGSAVTYYRTTISITKEQIGTGTVFIHFNGVDYKAHVFVNSSYVGSHEGFFGPFEFDLTGCVREGENTIFVKVENDYICAGNDAWGSKYSGDKIYAATGFGYDDPVLGWHHCPPGMGICQDVYIEFRPRVFIRDIFVRCLPNENKAEAWIEVYSCELENQNVEMELSVYGQNFDQVVIEHLRYIPKSVNISGLNDDFGIAIAKANGTYNKPIPLYVERGLNHFKIPFEMRDFRWWNIDEPWLYQLQVRLLGREGELIDTSKRHFGMRSFVMDEKSEPKGALYLNNKPIRLCGANTMGHEQQCVYKKDWNQLIDDILLAKICNMNFLRITQRPVQEEVYNYCDMLGLMTQTDLPLFGVLRINQYCEAIRQTAEMEKLVRSHPCNIMVSYINEPSPNAGNKPHRYISRDQMEDFFKAADDIVHHLNPERVTKACDGDYDPPAPGLQDRHCYPCWYNGHGVDFGRLHRGFWQFTKRDWYYACGEFGAEGLECEEVMRKYYPKDWLPQSHETEKSWSPIQIVRSQTGMFHYFFFDTQSTLKDWIDASQEHQAWSSKFMTEAFRRDNRMVSFAIHLFIDAFPSGWMKSIMDCERRPKKAFFAYRDALTPLLPTIRTDRFKFFSGEQIALEAWISNDLPWSPDGLKLHYQFESNRGAFYAQMSDAAIQKCNSTFQGYIRLQCPDVSERTPVVVRLGLIDISGKVLTDNSIKIEIFPKIKNSQNISACVFGGKNGPASRLAAELGISVDSVEKSSVILIDDFSAYIDNELAINNAAKNGARAIFLELQEGIYEIAGNKVVAKTSKYNPLHFASRKTGHPMVDSFKWDDFKHWYSPDADMVKPIIETTFTGAGYDPILTACNAYDQGKWGLELAVGQRDYGKGSFIISQIQLAGRTLANPAAKMFALRLLGA